MNFAAIAGDDTLAGTLGVLSAMITPAVLILACGSLLITTSNRLSRVIDRVRELSREIEDLVRVPADTQILGERRELLFELLGFAMRRGRLLQRAVTSLYGALGTFLSTSFTIGILALFQFEQATLALALSFIGSALMLFAAVLMVMEARIGMAALDLEIDFLRRRGQHHAPPGRSIPSTSWWRRDARRRPPL